MFEPTLINLGMYTSVGGEIRLVADRNTPIPGTSGNFSAFGPPVFDNGQVAFAASSDGLASANDGVDEGIYIFDGGNLKTVADTTTPIPGRAEVFRFFSGDSVSSLSLDDGVVAFLGFAASGEGGIYTAAGGELNVVADTTTVVPGTAEHFSSFDSVAIDGTNVAFTAFLDSSQTTGGVYVDIDGSLTSIIEFGQSLDGKTVAAFFMGSKALDQDKLAFGVGFTDGSQGIYIATIPEPATLPLLALGAALLRRRRSR